MSKPYVLLACMLLASPAMAQGLFENAVSGEAETHGEAPYELNGYIRGFAAVGRTADGDDEAETKSAYSEAAVKLRARKDSVGDGYAEVRYRDGDEFESHISEVDVREAYVSVYPGRFDIRIGKQILAWGRADGINPTDILTPMNMLVRSSDEDDRRLGNMLVRSFVTVAPFRIEAVWVPTYRPSVLPTSIMPLPSAVTVREAASPGSALKESSAALKVNIEKASFDGSVSYFNGYNPMRGIDAGTVTQEKVELVARPYRIHMAGADFSTVAGSYGLRGEIAYKSPEKDHARYDYIPNPELQYILGGDHEYLNGDLSIILQYVGKYVEDFDDLHDPVSPAMELAHMREQKNRMIAGQLDEVSHAVTCRPALSLLYDTLNIELQGMYNFTTEELLLKPKAAYDITDDLTVTLGGEWYDGPGESLFGAVEDQLSSVYVELRSSF